MQERSAARKRMSKKTSVVSRRAWNTLRLALLWARKGGLFRNRLELSLHVLNKGIRKLRPSSDEPQHGALVYGERELSFDETPVVHVNMSRPSSLRFKMPHIPCIKPQVDFDYDFDLEDELAHEEMCRTYVEREVVVEEEEQEQVVEEEDPDEEIDLKAEEFIARFHAQMKLQRQISYLQYKEKLNKEKQ